MILPIISAGIVMLYRHDKARYYVEHEDERKEIAKRGYDTIRKYHTHKIRAKQLLGYILELVDI